jgi:hypothetical protein
MHLTKKILYETTREHNKIKVQSTKTELKKLLKVLQVVVVEVVDQELFVQTYTEQENYLLKIG